MGETPSIPLDQLPSGFRFHPTDQELINDYLKPKINGRIKPAEATAVPEIEVLRYEPWDLPAKSAIRSADLEWFFFAPVDRKYPTGNRSNRATDAGYWKSTGQDRLIRSQPRAGPAVLIGKKKSLVFHSGRAPNGVGTNWIMHEYRTVESSGDRCGFVLCRLFRKSKKTVSGLIDNELEKNGFFPTATRSSPGSTLQRADDLEEEFATPLNQESPESDLQEELQPLPDTINKQSADKRLSDEEHHSIPYTVKPKESHCNSNMISDAGDQEAERAGLEMQPLPDTINKQSADNRLADEEHHSIPYLVKPKESHCNSNMISDAGDQEAERSGEEALFDELESLGPEYEDLLSDKFLQTKLPMPLSEDAIRYVIDQGLHNQTPYKMFEQYSGTEFLDIMRSTPEESSADLSIYQTDSATKVTFQSQASTINQSSDWNSAMDIGSDFDSEAPMLEPRQLFLSRCYAQMGGIYNENHPPKEQGGPVLEASALSRQPFLRGYAQMGTSGMYNENHPPMEVRCNSKGKSTPKLEPIETRTLPVHHSEFNENLTGPANYIRHRKQGNLTSSLNSSFDFPGQQAIGERGIRLQNSNDLERTCKQVSNVNTIHLVSTGTTEADEHAKYQTAEKAEADSDHEQSSSDDDGTASPTYMFVLTSEDYQKPTLRLRTRQTNDAGVKLESSSLDQEAPRVGSVPIVRIGVAMLIIFLLVAGTWLLNANAGVVL